MGDKNYFSLLFFVALCLLPIMGIWIEIDALEISREEYNAARIEYDNFESLMENLVAKNQNLKLINQAVINLSDIKKISRGKENEFLAEIHNLINQNNIAMIALRNDEPAIFKLNLCGNYYSFINLLADWRKIPFAFRITDLRITRNEILPSDFVDAELTLEAYISE